MMHGTTNIKFKHVFNLVHVSAFFGHRSSPWMNAHCVHSSMVLQTATETQGHISENEDDFPQYVFVCN